jgi:hypothetical protein
MITTVAENSKPVLDRLTLLQPVGSLSGKTSCAVLIWLVAWAALHGHWKDKQLHFGWVFGATIVLVGLGLVGTFPPVWHLFGE